MAVFAETNEARRVLAQAFLDMFSGGTLRLYAGSNSGNNYISSHALGSPAGTVAANGQVQLGTIGFNQSSINATGPGGINHGSLVNAGGTRQYRFNVSNAAGTGIDAVLTPTNVIAQGIPVAIGSFSFNIANI